jgi:hypothetical protein
MLSFATVGPIGEPAGADTQEDTQLVAKRTRGVTPTSAYRPGQAPARKSLASTSSPRPGSQPPAAIPGAAPRPSELDASVVLADPTPASAPVDVTPGRPAPVVSHQRGRIKVKPNSVLAARAAQEYVYVGEDLRHIVRVAGLLFGLLLLMWLVIVVANVFGLY